MNESTVDPAQFFQIASGLIPALLLGSAVRGRLRPRPVDFPELARGMQTRRGWRRFVVLTTTLLAFIAEVFAIKGALGGDLDVMAIWLISATLVVGTGLLAAEVAWPWLRLDPSRHVVRLTVVLNLAVAVICVAILAGSVQTAQSRIELRGAIEKSQRQTEIDLLLFGAQESEVIALRRSGRMKPAQAARELLRIATARRAYLLDVAIEERSGP